ncbi:MAG: hypothetical protein NC930_02940 [Candidatus Omnitrophica bacterium]|nr:hypothetical protein [Candidatus Omnitrophota bacterium]
MKRMLSLTHAFLLIFSSVPMHMTLADEYQDTIFDKMSDWASTWGKKGLEKDKILARRRADRVAKQAAKDAEKTKKEAKKPARIYKKSSASNTAESRTNECRRGSKMRYAVRIILSRKEQ